jgi:hypothetical protein
MNKTIVKSIAIICGLIGIYHLIAGFGGYVWFVSGMLKSNYPCSDQGLLIKLSTIVVLIVLLLRPIAGLGLFKSKNWGKRLTIGVLSADFLIRVSGALHTWTYSFRNPESERNSRQILNSVSEAQAVGQQVHFQTVSMIPSYIIAVVSLISVIVLLSIDSSEFAK